MRKKVMTSVYLEPEQADALKALSARTNVPQSVYVRQGVDIVLEAHAAEMANTIENGVE